MSQLAVPLTSAITPVPFTPPPPAAGPSLGDPVISYSPLYGHENLTDSAWHDDTWAFMEYGPITGQRMVNNAVKVNASFSIGTATCLLTRNSNCTWPCCCKAIRGTHYISPDIHATHTTDAHRLLLASVLHAFLPFVPTATAVSLYKSERWHDPYIGWHDGGELKGIQPTYGPNMTNDMDLLFGAKKPHVPYNFTLKPGEVG